MSTSIEPDTDANAASSAALSDAERRTARSAIAREQARRRLVGRSMQTLGVFGIVAGIFIMAIAVTQVSDVESTADRSVLLTSETLDIVADSLELTGTTVASLEVTIESVAAALESVQLGLGEIDTAVDGVVTIAGGSLSDTLTAIDDTLPTLETSARAIDSALGALDSTPFLDGYAPDPPLHESIASLDTALGPLVEDLETMDDDLAAVDTAFDEVSARLTVTIENIETIAEQVTSSRILLDRYRVTVADARLLASTYERDLDRGFGWLRWFGLLAGLFLALSQIVPLWLGRTLVDGSKSLGTLERALAPNHVVPTSSRD